MHDIITLIQQHIVTALQTDPEISNIVTGVYDQAPEQLALPYIEIASVSAELLPNVARRTYRGIAILRYHENYNGKQDSLSFIGIVMDAVNNIISDNSLFNIIISDVQIVSQNTDTKNNLLATEISVELYIDRIGE